MSSSRVAERRASYSLQAAKESAPRSSFDLLATAPNGVAKLRALILSLAVCGKLVAQHSDDEPANVLIKKLRQEKTNLLAAGKIKREKARPVITDDEFPYELPQGWQWSRLRELLIKIGAGSTPRGGREVYTANGVKFLRSQNVWNNGLKLDGVAHIPKAVHEQMSGTQVVAGDLLFNITGASIGRCALVPDDFDEANVSQHVTIIRVALAEVRQFLHLVLMSAHVQQTVMDVQVGVSREGLSIGKLGQFVVPLPPAAEQARIVARVEELMQLCDALEAHGRLQNEQHAQLVATLFDALASSESADALADNWQRIATHFDLLLDRPEAVDALEKTILQLAVRGLLVPQDPNEEPARQLLDRVRAEREHRIAAGEVKPDKPLPAITEGGTPFHLPKGWAWARFPELGEFGRGKSKHRPRNDPRLFNPEIYPLIQTGEVARADDFIEEVHSRYSEDGLAQSKLWPSGTLCITIAANVADSAILSFDACFPDSVVGFVPAQDIGDARYFLSFMKTARQRLIEFAPATAQKNINLEILSNVLIPLPPLKEMHRVVSRVEEIRCLCVNLRQRLQQSRNIQSRLADALVTAASQSPPC